MAGVRATKQFLCPSRNRRWRRALADGADAMTTIYVLFGESGEYSDRQEWVVRAYTSQADADADCVALNGASQALDRRYRDPVSDAVRMRLTPHDVFAEVGGDTTYSVTALTLASEAHVSAAAHADAREAVEQRERDHAERQAAGAFLANATSAITRFTGYQHYGKETA